MTVDNLQYIHVTAFFIETVRKNINEANMHRFKALTSAWQFLRMHNGAFSIVA